MAIDAIGLGLRTSPNGRAISAAGYVEATLFVAGPLARGEFGELMGLPEVSVYARFIVDQLIQALSNASMHQAASYAEPSKVMPA